MAEKTKGQELKDELFYKKKSAFEVKTAEELKCAMDYAEDYRKYLDNAKTEREAVTSAVDIK